MTATEKDVIIIALKQIKNVTIITNLRKEELNGKQGYRELIVKYLSALESDQIITTEQVAQHVAEQLSLEITVAKKQSM